MESGVSIEYDKDTPAIEVAKKLYKEGLCLFSRPPYKQYVEPLSRMGPAKRRDYQKLMET